MGTKKCTSCLVEQTIETNFYKHPKMADGYLTKCKKCVKSRVKKHRAENIETFRAYDRTRYHTSLARKEAARLSHRKWVIKNPNGPTAASNYWRGKNPEKYKAQNTVNNAIRDGKLERETCVICGEKAQAHHEDYSSPLAVVWLCPEHHSLHHVKKRKNERFEC